MGRATHNRHTQTRIKSGKDINIKTSTTILNSLQELKETTVLPKTIPHFETFPVSETVSDIYKSISDFTSLSEKIIKWYDGNEIIIKNQDQLASDMLHEFELSPPKDLWRAYKCYSKLRQSRQLRRKAKTENKMLYPLYWYIKSNPTLPKDLKLLCERCAGVQYDIDHAQYSFKTDLDVD